MRAGRVPFDLPVNGRTHARTQVTSSSSRLSYTVRTRTSSVPCPHHLCVLAASMPRDAGGSSRHASWRGMHHVRTEASTGDSSFANFKKKKRLLFCNIHCTPSISKYKYLLIFVIVFDCSSSSKNL
jgi:hypothetical protein